MCQKKIIRINVFLGSDSTAKTRLHRAESHVFTLLPTVQVSALVLQLFVYARAFVTLHT